MEKPIIQKEKRAIPIEKATPKAFRSNEGKIKTQEGF
jgi:hypothetical protein